MNDRPGSKFWIENCLTCDLEDVEKDLNRMNHFLNIRAWCKKINNSTGKFRVA